METTNFHRCNNITGAGWLFTKKTFDVFLVLCVLFFTSAAHLQIFSWSTELSLAWLVDSFELFYETHSDPDESKIDLISDLHKGYTTKYHNTFSTAVRRHCTDWYEI